MICVDVCNGITLHPEKFQFGQDTVTFAGFEITNNSVIPCCKFLDAIARFLTSKNIHGIRSWFGLINQVSYAFASSEKLQPFRHLLQPNTLFMWSNQLDGLFRESKSDIIQEIENGISISDKTSHLPCHRLVQEWFRVLAPTETLLLPHNCTLLLHHWLENYPGWQ